MQHSVAWKHANSQRRYGAIGLAMCMTVGLMGGCATPQASIDMPRVSLTDVSITRVALDGQTFILSFDVDNPNPFPLPVREVRYHIVLAEERFASGEASSNFSIPAGGRGDFDLMVELDILNQASALVAVVRNGMHHHIEYELHGSMRVDIPFTAPVAFSSTGSIQIAGKRF